MGGGLLEPQRGEADLRSDQGTQSPESKAGERAVGQASGKENR